MIEKDGLFYCDTGNRYVSEDIRYGMKYLIDRADVYDVKMPNVRKIYNFVFNKK